MRKIEEEVGFFQMIRIYVSDVVPDRLYYIPYCLSIIPCSTVNTVITIAGQ